MRRTQQDSLVNLETDTLFIKIMGQLEELKLLIYERLRAVTSEILGAIEKAITHCEDQASKLEKENGHHRPEFDIIGNPSIQTEGRCTCTWVQQSS